MKRQHYLPGHILSLRMSNVIVVGDGSTQRRRPLYLMLSVIMKRAVAAVAVEREEEMVAASNAAGAAEAVGSWVAGANAVCRPYS